ncbi:ATP-binding protein [Candidatus Woesearchaeota archaeon]|nr:ATP-binding protein [Candidatus Woesearchaeota archaeon]
MASLKFKSTADIKVPKRLIDQVLGQDEAVKVMKKSAEQRRHVLLIGQPGTGKSMLGVGLAELLPKEKLTDTLSFPNPNDENNPLIRTVPAGQGRDLVAKSRIQSMGMFKNQNVFLFILVIISMIVPWWARSHYQSDIMFAAFFLGGMVFLGAFVIFLNLGKRMSSPQVRVPKLIVDNFRKKQAPFNDATGAHAGALLGDCLHDPFQSFRHSQVVTKVGGKDSFICVEINKEIDTLFSKYENKIERRGNYEALHLSKDDLFILGETNGSISPVEVLSSNRYDYNGEMIKLTTSENKELVVTAEHKIAIWKNNKIEYIEAKDIKESDKVVSKSEDIIIDKQDIIGTYDERQQEQCRLYYQYLDIKSKNPTWGYKRIAKAMNQKIDKTRWWHAKKHIPVPIQTVQWLKKRELLPLRIDNPKLPLIAKVLGATFGDGGIFENLNAIFLSSKEKYNVEEFGRDIGKIFHFNKGENSRIIEGGEFGHSWCYQNTNRNIIRFFSALGSPIGKKSSNNLTMPLWIYKRDNFKQEFFGSLFGSELGIPKIHVDRVRLNTLDFAITGEKGLEQNRIEFIENIKEYLNSNLIKTGKISTRIVNTKYSKKESVLYRLLISTEFQNLIHFANNCKLNYCKYKRDKLTSTVNEFREEKRKKYVDLISQGYGAESAMNLLNLTPQALYEILNETNYVIKEPEAAYS